MASWKPWLRDTFIMPEKEDDKKDKEKDPIGDPPPSKPPVQMVKKFRQAPIVDYPSHK